MKKIIKNLALGIVVSVVSACSLMDKDNTSIPSPLTRVSNEVLIRPLWSTKTGSGIDNEYLKLGITTSNSRIFTVDHFGTVTATDKLTGKNLWTNHLGIHITSGPGAGDNNVLVGGSNGEVIALRQQDGSVIWHNYADSEVLAAPAASEGITLVKSIDGKITAFSSCDGHILWKYEQTEPTLFLRGASAPQIQNNLAVVGFANGNLAKLTLKEGSLLWVKTVAIPQGSFAIQRMVDIDADPIVVNPRIYAATYQGKIASLDFTTGQEIWSQDISSYAGIASDNVNVFVTDANSNLWAFDAVTGRIAWKQCLLLNRNITGPAVIGNYVVVGDAQGFLHVISKIDGHIAARIAVNRSGLLATPLIDGNVIYVTTRDGKLSSYVLG